LLAQETEIAAGGSIHPYILRGERDALRGEMTFFQSAFDDSLAYTQSALDRLPHHYFYARGLAALFQLMTLQSLGMTESALRQLNAWLDDEQLQHHTFRFLLLLAAGGIYGSTGDLKRLEQASQFLLTLGLAEENPLGVTWAHHFLGHVYYHWNRLDEAFAHWSAVPEWRYQANFRVYHEAMLGLALLRQTQGDEAQAQQTLDTLTQALLEMKQVQFAPEVEAFRARLALLRGDVGAAVHWTQSGTHPARMPLWYWETNELTRVKVLLAQHTTASRGETARLLVACREYAEKTGNVWLLIQHWALWALLAQAQGQSEEALAAAEQAVRLADPGGYLRLFVELGPDMADLLAQLAKRGVAPAYIGRILVVFRADQLPEAEMLTGRESEILALLQQGLSDKEIAERLVLSVLTVKKHNRNIYQKLDVNGRRAAIAKAKTLNLLP
jgi:LuxR family maltose regulon positive regulatory protein